MTDAELFIVCLKLLGVIIGIFALLFVLSWMWHTAVVCRIRDDASSFLLECWEDKAQGVFLYLIFCGGVVNIWVGWWICRWLYLHVRIV